jgi:chromatin segregation and condensation protein Rec8/ScpA/Scc1 (kleisin family)
MVEEETGNEYNFKDWTVKELREFASINNITIPTGSRKNDIIDLLNQVVSHPEFIDRTKEENLEKEILAGFDDEDGDLELKRRPTELKFWQKPPYSTLLNIELAKDSDIAFYDLASLVEKFFDKMLHEDLINFKVSGIALKTSASLHHHKITSVIKEEEEIQKQEKLEEMRSRTRRKIPKTLSQPIKPKLKMTSQDDLFDAMRAAIIDTMQKKEKLKRRRLEREEKKRRRRQEKSKAKLPKEILKHITGSDQTVEELHESWFNRIRATLKLDSKESTSFEEMMKLVKKEEMQLLGRKFGLVKLFLALMFLSNNNRIELSQSKEFDDIKISMK